MVKKIEWGFANGYKVFLITLTNKNGMSASFTNYGATLVNLCVPDKTGGFKDVTLGYDNLDGYLGGKSCQGAAIGRYGNRIGGAKFKLNGKEYILAKNNGANHLHGGMIGYNKRVWNIYGTTDCDAPSVVFSYVSPDGEENYPAEVKFNIRYTITENNSLKIDYSAVSDGDTVFNPTNHAYFNLGGYDSGDILNTRLQLFSDYYTPVDDGLIPTGKKTPVKGTEFDFNTPKLIGDDIKTIDIGGYDHNFILGDPGVTRKAAIAYDSKTGIEMTVYTDMPAIQLYIGLSLNEQNGKKGSAINKYGGFCLETQYSPNTPNMPDFPQCLLKKGEEFRSTTEYAFAAVK